LSGRSEERLNETKDLVAGSDHQSIPADLSSDAGINVLAEKLPALDGIVLNAGILKTVPVKYISADKIHELFRVNVEANILLIQALLKQNKINQGASICFISSIASKHVNIGNSLYSASKGAINSFTRALALELASKKIRSNAILPGFIETGIMANSPIGEEEMARHKANFPLGRFGQPEDVAHLATYLLSDASSWMTGSLITLDGGLSLK